MGYKGFVQLCHRTGQYTHLNAACLYEGMGIEENVLTGALSVTGKKLTDKVIGCAAYMRLKNGFEKAVYWSWDKIIDHAKRYSKSWGKPTSAWSTNPDDMGKKTVLMYMVKHWGVMSVQVQEAIGAEETNGNGAPVAQSLNDYIDIEATDPQPPAEPGLVIEGEQPTAFDPVKCLVENHISENEHAARNILKRIPDELKDSPDELIPVGKRYRAWKDSGTSTDQAIEYAIEGVPFE
jgi:recombination protein RecT